MPGASRAVAVSPTPAELRPPFSVDQVPIPVASSPYRSRSSLDPWVPSDVASLAQSHELSVASAT